MPSDVIHGWKVRTLFADESDRINRIASLMIRVNLLTLRFFSNIHKYFWSFYINSYFDNIVTFFAFLAMCPF